MDDREVVAAIAAGDPAGIAAAYDRYAAALFGYCHWMLRDPEDAAEALLDTFVIVAATIEDLPEPAKLRPWLYAMARSECGRRLRTLPEPRNLDADPMDQRADAAGEPINVADRPTDATMPMQAVHQPTDTTHQPTDATMPMRAVHQPTDTIHQPTDATMPMQAVHQPTDTTHQPTDATMPMRLVHQPTTATLTAINGDREHANLPRLVRAILAELKPREREVIELNLRHDLYDADLATALGMPSSQAYALASQTRSRLERALGTLLVTGTGRAACPALNALLADWDGQLTERTRDLVTRHVEHCWTCAGYRRGALRPAALSGLLPLAEFPPGLREQALRLCSSTTPDAIAYRRRVARRVESVWLARFSQATRRLRWDPEVAAAIAVGVVWIVVAASVALYLLGYHPAHALGARSSVGNPASSRTAAPASAPTSAAAKSSPTISHLPAVLPPPVIPSAPPTERAEPSLSPSASKSPSPSSSKSPSPKLSSSPSPSKTG
jgi:RNA polymerase sigma factor (sigma-70 family)